jgi:hypothetical protein
LSTGAISRHDMLLIGRNPFAFRTQWPKSALKLPQQSEGRGLSAAAVCPAIGGYPSGRML